MLNSKIGQLVTIQSIVFVEFTDLKSRIQSESTLSYLCWDPLSHNE